MITLIYTTIGDFDSANDLASKALDLDGVLCVNSFNINSSYVWNDKHEHSSEVAMLIKVRSQEVEDVMKFIELHHKYEVPFIVSVKADSIGEAYAKWINLEG